MISRLSASVVLASLLLNSATAQTIRFDTNVGNIDMVLNPTNDVNLQPNVDNILAYVNAGRYDMSVLNRAAEGFVLQYGGFSLNPLTIPSTFDEFIEVPKFDPVIVDADGDGAVDFTALSNTRGTVSLALSSLGPNSGTSSFFVNIGDNSGSLDMQDFVPFAEVPDMTTVDLIMSLPQASIPGGGLASQDFPTVNNASVVFIERAFVLEEEGPTSSVTFSVLTSTGDAEATSSAMVSTFSSLSAEAEGTLTTASTLLPGEDSAAPITFSTVSPAVSSALEANAGSATAPLTSSVVSAAAVQSVSVPEPPALVLAVGALVMIYIMKPSKKG